MIKRGSRGSTYQNIVENAIALYRARGVEHVSIQEICQAADVTRNAFYYYFDSRDVLFDAIADWVLERARGRVVTLYAAGAYYAQLWEFYHAFLSTQLEIGPEIMNRIFLARTQKESSDYYAYSYIAPQTVPVMADLIRRAQQCGQIRNRSDPEELVWASYAIVRGVNINWCFVLGGSDLLADSRRALDLLFEPEPGQRLYKGGTDKKEI